MGGRPSPQHGRRARRRHRCERTRHCGRSTRPFLRSRPFGGRWRTHRPCVERHVVPDAERRIASSRPPVVPSFRPDLLRMVPARLRTTSSRQGRRFIRVDVTQHGGNEAMSSSIFVDPMHLRSRRRRRALPGPNDRAGRERAVRPCSPSAVKTRFQPCRPARHSASFGTAFSSNTGSAHACTRCAAAS